MNNVTYGDGKMERLEWWWVVETFIEGVSCLNRCQWATSLFEAMRPLVLANVRLLFTFIVPIDRMLSSSLTMECAVVEHCVSTSPTLSTTIQTRQPRHRIVPQLDQLVNNMAARVVDEKYAHEWRSATQRYELMPSTWQQDAASGLESTSSTNKLRLTSTTDPVTFPPFYYAHLGLEGLTNQTPKRVEFLCRFRIG